MKYLPSVLILLLAGSASAVVVSDYSVATNPPAGSSWDVNWDSVHYYEDMSAVAVGTNWLLTAAHAAMEVRSSDVEVNGTTYHEQAVYLHGTADLALVRFDKPFPGYYPLYSSGTLVNKSIVMIGYGNTGTVYSTHYAISGTGSGVKRWGSNKIDRTYTNSAAIHNYRAGETVMVNTVSSGFVMGFNQSVNTTDYEAGAAVYDSGGGTFIKDGSTWKLAGINTAMFGSSTTNVTGTFAVSIPSYFSWITNTIAQADGDADSDGIPNWWEAQYGSTTGVVATADADNDGLTGEQEYVADTSPTNPASFFEMGVFSVSTNQTFYFTGSTARKYQLFYTTNDLAVTNFTWTAAHTNLIWGSGTNSSITVTNSSDKAFYRLRVTLP